MRNLQNFFDKKDTSIPAILKLIQNNEVEKLKIALLKNSHTQPNEELLEACTLGNKEVVSLLIMAGADIKYKNNQPVRIAAGYGHLEVVQYLLELGADRNVAERFAIKDVRQWFRYEKALEKMNLLSKKIPNNHSKEKKHKL